jgi:hypothetical protein
MLCPHLWSNNNAVDKITEAVQHVRDVKKFARIASKIRVVVDSDGTILSSAQPNAFISNKNVINKLSRARKTDSPLYSTRE